MTIGSLELCSIFVHNTVFAARRTPPQAREPRATLRSKKDSRARADGTVSTQARAQAVRGPDGSGARKLPPASFNSEPAAALLDGYAQKWWWLEWLVPAMLCALLFGELFFSGSRLSQTCDESTHLYAGYRYWKCGDFGYGSEHPPLAKLVAALPLLASGAPANCAIDGNEAAAALDWLYAMPDWEARLTRARAAVSIFALGLCVLVWVAARRMFGFPAAVLATVVLAFDPNILASGGLVMTDMAITFAFPFAVYTYYLYFRDRSRRGLVLAGVATGLVLVAKNSGVVVLPVLLLLALSEHFVCSDRKRQRWRSAVINLGGAVLICAIALGVLWTVYGLHFGARRYLENDDYWASRAPSSAMVATLHDWHMLPEAYLGGLHVALGLATEDAGPYLLGHTYAHGQWFYFPVVMLVKSTAALLMGLALSAVGLWYLRRERRRELLFLLLPAGIFLLVCMSAVNSMMRHVLPIYPLAFILIAAATVELARRHRWVWYAALALLVLHVASSLHAYPFYLSYANEFFGGPSKLYKRLPVSDMGEGIKEVRAYAARHSGPCWLLSPFQMNPNFYGTGCAPLMSYWTQGWNVPGIPPAIWTGGWTAVPGIPPAIAGTVFVSSTLLPENGFSAIRSDQRGLFTAFARRPPDDVIAGSAVLVYKGDFDTQKLAASGESAEVVEMMASGKSSDGLLHARKAVELDSSSSVARAELCVALVDNGSPPETRKECEMAKALLEKASLTNAPLYKLVQELVWILQSGDTPSIRNSPVPMR